jgi:hypothetical protein
MIEVTRCHDAPNNQCAERRLPFASLFSEGQNACVIGPNEEIICEITHGDRSYQAGLAGMIAAMLNDLDDNHSCNPRAKRSRAQHFLLLVRQNVVRDNEAMETLSLAIDEAGAQFSRAEIEELTGGNIPF